MSSVRARLTVGSAANIALLAIAVAVALISANTVRASYSHTVRVSDALIDNTDTRIKLRDDEETGLRGYLLTSRRAFLQPYFAARQQIPGVYAVSRARSEPGAGTRLQRMYMAAQAWERWSLRVLSRPPSTTNRQALLASQEVGKRLFDRFRRQANGVLVYLRARRARDLRAAGTVDRLTFDGLIAIFIVGLLLMLLISRSVIRSITRPLRSLTDVAGGIGHGDLDEPVRITAAEEFTALARQMDDMRLRLKEQRDAVATLTEQLAKQARIDALTECWNRLRLEEDLAQLRLRAERYRRPFSIAVCDVDHFKYYNDHYGHAGGDRVLRDVARVLRECSRKSDTVYRYGGEEFVIVFPEASLAGAVVASEKLRASVEGLDVSTEAPGSPGYVTISVGVAEWRPEGDETIDEVLRRADAALYLAKAAGRNRVETAGEAPNPV